jgi:hypothetical protein
MAANVPCTEEEAKGKWCPHLPPVDLPPGNYRAVNCLGGRCMMWRWLPSLTIDNPTHSPGAGQTINRKEGYCGLGGRP